MEGSTPRPASGNSFLRILLLFGIAFPVGPIRRRVSSSLPLSLASSPPSASLRIAGSSESGICRTAGFSQDGELGSRVFERRSIDISGCEARCIVESGERRGVETDDKLDGMRDGWLYVEGARRVDVVMLGFELDLLIACLGVMFASSSSTGMAPRDRERLYEFRASSTGGYNARCDDRESRRWSQLPWEARLVSVSYTW